MDLPLERTTMSFAGGCMLTTDPRSHKWDGDAFKGWQHVVEAAGVDVDNI